MKKRKFITFLLMIAFVFPIVFLSACKDKDKGGENNTETGGNNAPAKTVESVSVELANQNYTLVNDTISVIYSGALITIGDTDFTVKVVYSDDTTETITKAEAESTGYTFASTLPTEGVTAVGSYTLSFTYGELLKTITVNVTKAQIDLANVTWGYVSPFNYDGAAKTIALTNLPAGVTAEYTENSKTNAGSYTATAVLSYDEANYELVNVPELTKAWVINKANYDVSNIAWNYTAPFTYDGSPKTIALIGLPTGVTAEYVSNSKTNASSYTATATLKQADTTNYNLLSTTTYTKEWVINKANYDMSDVRWNYSEPFKYDGFEKTIALIGLPEDVQVISYDGVSATEIGTYHATVSLTQTDMLNYNIVDSSVYNLTWHIEKGVYNMLNVRWNYSQPFEYDGELKTVSLVGLPAGVTADYAENSKTNAGTYTATVEFTQVDTTNYEIVDGSAYTLIWTINKANYDLSQAKWQYSSNDAPTNWIDYTEPLENSAVGYSVQLVGLPAGLTVTGYNLSSANGTGSYVTIPTIEQTDTTNYELVTGEALKLEWEILAEQCLSSVMYNTESKTQRWFETVDGILTGNTISITVAEGYYFLGDASTTLQFSEQGEYEVIVIKTSTTEEVLRKTVRIYPISSYSINGEEFSGSNRYISYEIESLSLQTITIDLGKDPASGMDIYNVYGQNITLIVSGVGQVPLTSNTITLNVADLNYGEGYRLFAGETLLLEIIFEEYSYLESLTVSNYNEGYDDYETPITKSQTGYVHDFETFITGVNVVLKDEFLSTHSYKLFNGTTEITQDFFKNIGADENYITVKVYNGSGEEIESITFIVKVSPDLANTEFLIENKYYIHTTEANISFNGFTVDGVTSKGFVFAGLNQYELVYTQTIRGSVYTLTAPVVINYSPAITTAFTSYIISENSNRHEISETNRTSVELYISQILELNLLEEYVMVDGYEFVSATLKRTEDIYYIEIIARHTATSVDTSYLVYLQTRVDFDNDTTVASAEKYDAITGEYTTVYDFSGDTVTITDASNMSTIDVETTNRNAKIEFLGSDGVSVIKTGYGFIELSFTEGGTYYVKITPTSYLGTPRTIQLNVSGEFSPLMELTWGTTVLEMNMEGSEMPTGNMELVMGIDPTKLPTAIQTWLSGKPYNPQYGMMLIGYLGSEAAEIQTPTITLSLRSFITNVYDLTDTLITKESFNATITTDATYGKYVMLWGDFEGGVTLTIIYLSEKVYPLSMTLGTVEKNVELNYQFEFDYENEAGNMHFGSFDMTESGMIATVSASDIGLTEGVTELSLTLNYSQVFGDYSYAAIFNPEADEPTIIVPVVGTLSYLVPVEIPAGEDDVMIMFYVAFEGATEEDFGEKVFPLIIVIER